MIGCPDPEPGLDIRESGGEADEIGFLWQVLDTRAGLEEAFSSVGVYQPGRNPQQGRFSGAVAADETDPVAGGNGQSRASEQRRCPEGQADVLQHKQRRHVRHLALRFTPNRRKPRLPVSRQAGWPVVMVQLDETGRSHVIAPCVQVKAAGITTVAESLFVIPSRI